MKNAYQEQPNPITVNRPDGTTDHYGRDILTHWGQETENGKSGIGPHLYVDAQGKGRIKYLRGEWKSITIHNDH